MHPKSEVNGSAANVALVVRRKDLRFWRSSMSVASGGVRDFDFTYSPCVQ